MQKKKSCPRCRQSFECKPGNITQCQCYDIELNEKQKIVLEEKYKDCLCRACLQEMIASVEEV